MNQHCNYRRAHYEDPEAIEGYANLVESRVSWTKASLRRVWLHFGVTSTAATLLQCPGSKMAKDGAVG